MVSKSELLSGLFIIGLISLVYFSGLFFLLITFSKGLTEVTIQNRIIHFLLCLSISTFATWFSRLFYVPNLPIKYDLGFCLFWSFVYFVIMGVPAVKSV